MKAPPAGGKIPRAPGTLIKKDDPKVVFFVVLAVLVFVNFPYNEHGTTQYEKPKQKKLNIDNN